MLLKEPATYSFTRDTANFIAIVSALYENLPRLQLAGTLYENIPPHRIAESFLVDCADQLLLVNEEIHAILWLYENLDPQKHTVEEIFRTLWSWPILGCNCDEYIKDWLLWLIDNTSKSAKWYQVLSYVPSNKLRIAQIADEKIASTKVKSAPSLYINIGASGSGKSTSSASRVETGAVYYSRDDLLLKHFSDKFPEIKDPFELYSACWKASTANKQFDKDTFVYFKSLLEANKSVVVDNTNVSVATRAKFIEEANKAGYNIYAVMHYISLRELLKRRKLRPDKTVPFSAVTSQYARIEQPWLVTEVEDVLFAENATNKEPE